jgi:hypothetical protein
MDPRPLEPPVLADDLVRVADISVEQWSLLASDPAAERL